MSNFVEHVSDFGERGLPHFVNRERELARLDAVRGRPGAQLVAMYGRRRIGKTALLLEWLRRQKQTPSAFWVAQRSTSQALLEKLSDALRPLLGLDQGLSFASWDAALTAIGRRASKERVVLVIDELPYLLESVPPFATLLQAKWDHELSKTKLCLVVAGSRFHMMHQTLVAARGPLFGRTTADMLVDEVDLPAMQRFLPRYSSEQLVETYSVIGGVPKYLEMWDTGRPVLWNVEQQILSPVTMFRTEPMFLVQDELAEPRTYLAILEAIGTGAARPTRIAERCGIALNHVGKYLHTLQTLGFVSRLVSVDAHGRSDTRDSRYQIRDPYLHFHFRFLQPNLQLIEQGRTARLMQLIREGFDAHVGKTGYEELCRRHVARLADERRLPFDALHVGRLWSRSVEIDVAAVDQASRSVLLGECRWRRKRMGPADLADLEARAARLTKLARYTKHYALCSRGGFTKSLEAAARERGVLLIEGVGGHREASAALRPPPKSSARR